MKKLKNKKTSVTEGGQNEEMCDKSQTTDSINKNALVGKWADWKILCRQFLVIDNYIGGIL